MRNLRPSEIDLVHGGVLSTDQGRAIVPTASGVTGTFLPGGGRNLIPGNRPVTPPRGGSES